jgi:hypothetical protein
LVASRFSGQFHPFAMIAIGFGLLQQSANVYDGLYAVAVGFVYFVGSALDFVFKGCQCWFHNFSWL